MRASVFYLISLVLLFAVIFFQRQIESLPDFAYRILDYLPLVLLSSSMLVAVLLRQSRVFFMMLVLLAVFDYGFPAHASAKREIMVDMLSVILPLVSLFLAYTIDRGVLSRFGLIRLIGLILLLFVCDWLALNQPVWLIQFFEWQWLDINGPMDNWSQPGLVIMAVSVLLLLHHARQTNTSDTHLFLIILLGFVFLVESARTQITIAAMFSLLALLALLATAFNLLQKAYHDELTGLAGRRALKEQLLRVSANYVVAMLDVDHFKKFNDTYGHDVGDQVLKFVAEKMTKVGSGGKIYRYGGEEFTFVFAGKTRQGAEAALEAVREDIAISKFGMRKKGLGRRSDKSRGRGAKQYVGVTVSIGATEANARTDDYEEAIKRADRALYDAKNAGRNCLQWK